MLAQVEPEEASSLCGRYNAAYEALATAGGSVSQSEAMAILKEVSAPRTIWSVMYDLTTGDVAIVTDRDYAQLFIHCLGMIGATVD